ncbi:hypothetical protein F5Y19DRAFT_122019 [Xylariaceae sp. FL1651]|nr:hypothetical protein F5Y19DRAFT_122019 [Xylariaceae sp. FL1651]
MDGCKIAGTLMDTLVAPPPVYGRDGVTQTAHNWKFHVKPPAAASYLGKDTLLLSTAYLLCITVVAAAQIPNKIHSEERVIPTFLPNTKNVTRLHQLSSLLCHTHSLFLPICIYMGFCLLVLTFMGWSIFASI